MDPELESLTVTIAEHRWKCMIMCTELYTAPQWQQGPTVKAEARKQELTFLQSQGQEHNTVWVKKNPPRGPDIFSFFSQTVKNL